MYIKSMVIDGFKSYGQRTEINDFDTTFNAITGLNGSGKSNILDAICFLLGITNLDQVRAKNLQDLIYKSGQAGIQKAGVSITFDNTDKTQSPVGYETHDIITITRQIVMGGRNKYLINGTNATNTRVQDLFGSVQLNVNNPHFLIMQGRVTKVLNMKPQEILLMIEEAAGTRMYEAKRQSAQRLIGKKDAKLNDIDVTLKESIIPTISRLKEERQSYLEYQKTARELEALTKFYTAWQFTICKEIKEKSDNDTCQIRNDISKCHEETEKLKEAINEIDEHIKKAELLKNKESKDILSGLEAALKEKQIAETKVSSEIKNIEENLKTETKKMNETSKHLDNDQVAYKNKNEDLENLLRRCEGILAKGKSDEDNFEAAQKHVEALSTGLSTNEDGAAATLADQLMQAKSEIARCEAEFQTHEVKLNQMQKEIKEKRRNCQGTENSFKQDDLKLRALIKELENLKIKIDSIGYDDDMVEQLTNRSVQLRNEVRQLEIEIDSVESRCPNLCFQYKDPYPGFDRRKVHGFVSKLIKVKDPETCTALEVTAGGRLNNVVVDNEITGKDILDKGNLRQRTTMIPLNKVTASSIDQQTFLFAENQVGKGNVWTALSLVEYDNILDPAMKFCFGSTLVCRTMDQGKTLAFHNRIKKRTVTLDGDVFDPSGVLSGGSRKNNTSILRQMTTLKELESKLKDKRKAQEQINQELNRINTKKNQYQEAKTTFDAKENEANLIKTRIEMGTHYQLMEELKQLEADVKAQEESHAEAQRVKIRMENKVKELELNLKDAKAYRERDLKAAQENLAKWKGESEKSKKEYQKKQNEVASLRLEVEELKKAAENDKLTMEEIEKTIQLYRDEIKRQTELLVIAQGDVGEVSEKMAEKRKEIQCHSEGIRAFQSQKNENEDHLSQLSVKIKQLQHDLNKTLKEASEAEKKLNHFMAQYDWIEHEQENFGKPNSEYDFEGTDPKETGRRIQRLTESKDKLSKNINTRAQNMMNKSETEYQDLLKKKKTVENDKKKLLDIIEDLDHKKRNALKVAYQKVNMDFGSIFSSLLNNAQAKLEPPQGKTVLDGLEIKVAFNDTWKESLNELSGGQRSLVALSLVLAMLLFKPAPIYILDEVDAALDISHTQNIGQMLRVHFKSSQFIIVSLKDGMFNNANVLFKTKFVDGNSTVTRHTQHPV